MFVGVFSVLPGIYLWGHVGWDGLSLNFCSIHSKGLPSELRTGQSNSSPLNSHPCLDLFSAEGNDLFFHKIDSEHLHSSVCTCITVLLYFVQSLPLPGGTGFNQIIRTVCILITILIVISSSYSMPCGWGLLLFLCLPLGGTTSWERFSLDTRSEVETPRQLLLDWRRRRTQDRITRWRSVDVSSKAFRVAVWEY